MTWLDDVNRWFDLRAAHAATEEELQALTDRKRWFATHRLEIASDYIVAAEAMRRTMATDLNPKCGSCSRQSSEYIHAIEIMGHVLNASFASLGALGGVQFASGDSDLFVANEIADVLRRNHVAADVRPRTERSPVTLFLKETRGFSPLALAATISQISGITGVLFGAPVNGFCQRFNDFKTDRWLHACLDAGGPQTEWVAEMPQKESA